MPNEAFAWFGRIKAVEREHSATRLAVDRLLSDAQRDPTVLPSEQLRIRDVLQTSERLDGTFIIRLFAEFETGLRLYWPSARATDAPARTRDLRDSLAATRRIPHDDLANGHLVREYRNSLVHERDEPTESIPVPIARKYLCKFFARLPPNW
jgi:hypothetical protein